MTNSEVHPLDPTTREVAAVFLTCSVASDGSMSSSI